MRVAFLIPAHNEERSIAEVLTRIELLAIDRQVIVDDDGSSDPTATITEGAGATVLRQPHRGKVQRSARQSPTSTLRSSSSRTQTWNTTQPKSQP
jgi:glycosyltransferase involved in cell wall biosynthesis